jgi:hypothetical protein
VEELSRSKAVEAVGSGGTEYLRESEGKGKGTVLPRTGREGPEGGGACEISK